MESVSIIVGSLAVIVSAISAMVALHAYRAQSDPVVIVYLEHDKKRPTIMNLIIKNIGAGLAHDVTFELPEHFPQELFGMNARIPADLSPMTEGPLVDGIRSLPPGGERIVSWGQYGGMMNYMLGSPKSIRVAFFRRGSPYFLEQRFESNSVLEIESFVGTDCSITSVEAHLKNISESLKKLAEN